MSAQLLHSQNVKHQHPLSLAFGHLDRATIICEGGPALSNNKRNHLPIDQSEVIVDVVMLKDGSEDTYFSDCWILLSPT